MGVGIGGTELGFNIGGTKMGSDTRGTELVVSTRGTEWAKRSLTPKLEFDTTAEEQDKLVTKKLPNSNILESIDDYDQVESTIEDNHKICPMDENPTFIKSVFSFRLRNSNSFDQESM